MSVYDGIRTHTLYLSSANRGAQDTPWHLTFDVPEGAIYLDDAAAQNMKISLVSFAFRADWSEVNADNNTLRVRDHAFSYDVVLTPGNYPFDTLARAIARGLAAQGATVTCKWDQPTNKLVFTDTDAQLFVLEFPNASWQVLGFAPDDPAAATFATTHVSSHPLVARQTSELYVRLNNVTCGDGNMNYTNLTAKGGGTLTPTTILSPIPVTAAPFTSQWTDNSVFGQVVGVFVSNDVLHTLAVDIVDAAGNYADWIGDWTATIKVQVVPVREPGADELQASVDAIRDAVAKLLILQVVGAPQINRRF